MECVRKPLFLFFGSLEHYPLYRGWLTNQISSSKWMVDVYFGAFSFHSVFAPARCVMCNIIQSEWSLSSINHQILWYSWNAFVAPVQSINRSTFVRMWVNFIHLFATASIKMFICTLYFVPLVSCVLPIAILKVAHYQCTNGVRCTYTSISGYKQLTLLHILYCICDNNLRFARLTDDSSEWDEYSSLTRHWMSWDWRHILFPFFSSVLVLPERIYSTCIAISWVLSGQTHDISINHYYSRYSILSSVFPFHFLFELLNNMRFRRTFSIRHVISFILHCR